MVAVTAADHGPCMEAPAVTALSQEGIENPTLLIPKYSASKS